ncbi:MAG TPA: aminotransferase class I/II-fold pyridoxal phosphate-dependent enzyme, partial [bacterium]|nr:aminotransferase class I/II-fold pyridoxal phosphate-dependent enzyme [bacterium]
FVFDKIDKSIFKSCKGFVLVNPNNPTGSEYDEEDIKKLSHQCNKDGVILISDEAYGFFSKKGYPASSVLNITGSLNNLIVVNTFSKTFSMTGFRVAYVLAQKAFMDQIMKVQDSVIICAPKVSQYMALYGLKECHSWLDEKVKYVQSNASHFRELCKTQLKGFSLSSCANFFAYIKHPFNDISSYEASIKVAQQAKILTLPGAIFGPEQDSYLRLAFGNVSDPSKLSEVVSRLSAM